MKQLLASTLGVAMLLLGASAASATALHVGSQIGGRVVDSLNQGPLGGVRVDVFQDSGSGSKIVTSTTTAKDGSFSVGGLSSGSYHLELEKRGYALAIVTGFSLTSDERFLITRPLGMRTAVVMMGVGKAMETHL
jgi:5-hydroxyisourate hydrolase-like protein (transthyretin family)